MVIHYQAYHAINVHVPEYMEIILRVIAFMIDLLIHLNATVNQDILVKDVRNAIGFITVIHLSLVVHVKDVNAIIAQIHVIQRQVNVKIVNIQHMGLIVRDVCRDILEMLKNMIVDVRRKFLLFIELFKYFMFLF